MNEKLEQALSSILTLAAVVVAGSLVHRELREPSPPVLVRESAYVKNWRTFRDSARIIGSREAPITLVEFTDFQCPYCARFHESVRRIRALYPDQVAIALVHFPLPGHAHARGAAQALECADGLADAEVLTGVMFAQQDSLGKKSWMQFAMNAGLTDTTRFALCMADSTPPARVRAGLAVGADAKITATPTILLNGWRFGEVPSEQELVRVVKDLLAGRRPFPDFPKGELDALK